ncbi:hypothetical protein HDV57DRAFT_106746 [Trichoderma longibrachiatum]
MTLGRQSSSCSLTCLFAFQPPSPFILDGAAVWLAFHSAACLVRGAHRTVAEKEIAASFKGRRIPTCRYYSWSASDACLVYCTTPMMSRCIVFLSITRRPPTASDKRAQCLRERSNRTLTLRQSQAEDRSENRNSSLLAVTDELNGRYKLRGVP